MKGICVQIELLVAVLVVIALSGCNPGTFLKSTVDQVAPDDDEALAKDYFGTLRARDFATATRLLDPQIVGPGIESKLATVADFLDRGEPLSMELVGCNVVSASEKRRSILTYQYHFADSWLLASITIDTIDGTKRVFGVHVKPIPRSLGELNAFTFANKGVRHYVMLLLAVAIPTFILVVLVLCIRTKMRRLKWLWIIFILFGFGNLGLNWTTGQLLFNPLSVQVQLFGAAAAKYGPYAPWIISISVPLGAVVFLLIRKRLAVVRPSPVEYAAKESPETEHGDPARP